MDLDAGQHANTAIFAANGPFRRRLLKAACAASSALLAAWLLALALGVWGGFELLPGLPGSPSTHPSEASSKAQHPSAPATVHSRAQTTQSGPAVRIASHSAAGGGRNTSDGSGGRGSSDSVSGGGTTRSEGSNPNTAGPKPVQPPSAASTPPSTGPEPTTTTGVPADSPGSLPSAGEMPGQLP